MSYMQVKEQGQFNKKTLKFRVISRRGVGVSGFQFLFYKFIPIQTAVSQLIYEILKKNFQLLTPFYQIFWIKTNNLGDPEI